MSLSFQDCKYQWQLQETLGNEFARLPWQMPAEFDRVITILQKACELTDEQNKLTHDFNGLNDQLQKTLKRILDYIDVPDNYISGDFVKQNLEVFGLEPTYLPQDVNEFDKECQRAHQAIVLKICNERAAHFAGLPVDEREQLIITQASERKKIQDSQQSMRNKEAPQPGSEKSTHQLILTKFLGGQQRFEAIVAELESDPRISECYTSLGNLYGILTDEENLRWKFEITARKDDNSHKEYFVVFVNNFDLLNLNPEEPSRAFNHGQCVSYEAYNSDTFPQGQYQLRTTTITDQLITFIQQTAYEALCFGYGHAYDINQDAVRQAMQNIRDSNDFPARENLRSMVQGLVAPAPTRSLTLAFLQEFLSQYQNAFNTEREDGEAPLVTPLFQLQSSLATSESLGESVSQAFVPELAREAPSVVQTPRRNPPREARSRRQN